MNPRPLLALAAVIVLPGIQIACRGSSSEPDTAQPTVPRTSAETTDRGPVGDPDKIASVLRRAVRSSRLDGSVQAAAMASDWDQPVAVADGNSVDEQMRMWSMSKVVVLVALLDRLGWGDEPGKPLGQELESAVRGAITRSENCRQRRVVLELQQLTGGVGPAAAMVRAVLARAGASGADVTNDVEPPEDACVAYLSAQRDVSDPLGDAVLFGVSEWRAQDAARFANALASGVYGNAIRRKVIGLMAEPKRESREIPPGAITAPTDWGAGEVFDPGEVAYKAGWGGSEQDAFLAGQMVVIPLRDDRSISIAVMAHPAAQPPVDDPGLTSAPTEIQHVLNAFHDALPRNAQENGIR